MKAIRVHAPGGPEVLRYEDVPQPVPGPREVLVKIDAAGVNYIDVYQRTGRHPTPPPYTLGQEAAGTVAALGSEVGDVRPGDRVAYTGILGGYAEFAAVPAERLVALPDGVSTKRGAAAMLQGMTAHYLACTTYPLKPGDTCRSMRRREESVYSCVRSRSCGARACSAPCPPRPRWGSPARREPTRSSCTPSATSSRK
jgi:NADPH2:quinone reductase